MRITGRRVSESTNVSNHLKAIPLHCQTSPYAPVVFLSIPLGIHTCASQCYGLTSLPNSKHHLKNTQRYHQGKEKYLQFYPSPLKIHEECIWKSLNRSLFYFGRTYKWKSLSCVRPTLWDSMDYTVHGILQARILQKVAVPFSRGSFQPRDRTQVYRIAGGFFTSWATREALEEDIYTLFD